MAELSIASNEVLPDPTPTAGTLPTWFDLVEVGAAACTSEPIGLVTTTLDGEVVLGAAPAGEDVVRLELRSARSDVFPPPTPTAGTLPSSLPFEVEAGGVASDVIGETPVAPVCLARSR